MKNLSDLEIVQNILPAHYDCKVVSGGIHCKSSIGISDETKEGEEQWENAKAAFKAHLGRYKEIFHQTCSNHSSFTIYI